MAKYALRGWLARPRTSRTTIEPSPARSPLFAIGRPFALVVIGIALHGICFDFFFAAGFIHVEQTAPKAIQVSGQALFAVLTYGLGMWIGSEASGWLF